MSPSSSFRQELLRRTSEAVDRLSRARARRASRGGEAPRPGDLYVLSESAGDEVLWAVLERQRQHRRRFFVVPADLDPRLASGDVAVSPPSSCGALTLRCRFGFWLAADAFAPRLRAGELSAEDLRRARRARLRDRQVV